METKCYTFSSMDATRTEEVFSLLEYNYPGKEAAAIIVDVVMGKSPKVMLYRTDIPAFEKLGCIFNH